MDKKEFIEKLKSPGGRKDVTTEMGDYLHLNGEEREELLDWIHLIVPALLRMLGDGDGEC